MADGPAQLIKYQPNGDIVVWVSSVAEAKAAIKQLKLDKKRLALDKRENEAQMRQIRQDRSAQIARQGPMMRGGGGLGQVIRAFQSTSRAGDRQEHAAALQPYLQRKADIDGLVHGIDGAIFQIERYIVESQEQSVLTAVAPSCRSCDTGIPLGARFCPECGASVDE